MIGWDPSWNDRTASWWVKADRAAEHIRSLRGLVDAFMASEPYALAPEPTGEPNRVAYRFYILRPVPSTIQATIGDILSNLRSALESLAFELALMSHGGVLTKAQEAASTFPIRRTPAKLIEFFTGKGRLYGERAQEALHAVQPFADVEMAAAHLGSPTDPDYELAFKWDELRRINAAWNTDKHRRLMLLGLRPDLIWWGSNTTESNRRMLPGDGSLANGSILFYIEGKDEGQDTIYHEFKLVLIDDPAFGGPEGSLQAVVELLESWHRHVAFTVFHRVFAVMSQRTDLPLT